jgi:hypothetical protein
VREQDYNQCNAPDCPRYGGRFTHECRRSHKVFRIDHLGLRDAAAIIRETAPAHTIESLRASYAAVSRYL